MRRLGITLSAVALLVSCGDNGIIYNKSPFSRAEYTFEDQNSEEFISRSIEFASAHELETAVNRFGGGRFSVLLYNQNLNLVALNTTRPRKITIDATSRHEPTPAERQLAEQYVDHVASLLD